MAILLDVESFNANPTSLLLSFNCCVEEKQLLSGCFNAPKRCRGGAVSIGRVAVNRALSTFLPGGENILVVLRCPIFIKSYSVFKGHADREVEGLMFTVAGDNVWSCKDTAPIATLKDKPSINSWALIQASIHNGSKT